MNHSHRDRSAVSPTSPSSSRKRWRTPMRTGSSPSHASRIVEAGDTERRRLERNLHDGAQQRLVSLALRLRLIKGACGRTPNLRRRCLAEAESELDHALEELRELARGIHPAVLTDRGLEAAVRALADRAPIPVELARASGRPTAGIRRSGGVLPRRRGDHERREVRASDTRKRCRRTIKRVCDGGRARRRNRRRGRAVPGSGLVGLADRVEALGGRLHIESPPGQGTQLTAEIPVPKNDQTSGH